MFDYTCTCSSVQVSSVTDLTFEMCVPSFLWMPPHRMQRNTPIFQEAHLVPSRSSITNRKHWSAYLFVHNQHNICWLHLSGVLQGFVHFSCSSFHETSSNNPGIVFDHVQKVSKSYETNLTNVIWRFDPKDGVTGSNILKSSVQRNIKKELVELMPPLASVIDDIIPKKSNIVVTKWYPLR